MSKIEELKKLLEDEWQASKEADHLNISEAQREMLRSDILATMAALHKRQTALRRVLEHVLQKMD